MSFSLLFGKGNKNTAKQNVVRIITSNNNLKALSSAPTNVFKPARKKLD
jgi:hypothetical protein